MNLLKRLFGPRPAKKRIYFVRHGESVLNAQHIRQGAEGALSQKGKEQARLTAERIKLFPIDVMIVSPYERTTETAAIINTFLHKPTEYSDLLKERRNPSEIVGKWADDPEARNIIDRIDKSFHAGNLRFSDEENYEDLKARAEALLDFLAARPEQNILCVTHYIFLTMVIAVMLYRENLRAEDYIKLSFFNQSNNAAITVCEYDASEKDSENKGWSLLAWNDYDRSNKK
jgi:broad specificity phosphatase PhoE